jgi:hypothetical protein
MRMLKIVLSASRATKKTIHLPRPWYHGRRGAAAGAARFVLSFEVIVVTPLPLVVAAEDREEEQEHVQGVEEDRGREQRRAPDRSRRVA